MAIAAFVPELGRATARWPWNACWRKLVVCSRRWLAVRQRKWPLTAAHSRS